VTGSRTGRTIIRLVALLFGGVLITVAAWLLWPAYTPTIKGKAPIASLQEINLGGAKQWVLIRGEDSKNPVVLFLHGGPGMPAMYLAHSFQRELESNFVVVQWDRRGAGKSYRADLGSTLTSEQLVSDTVELLEILRERFQQQRIILVGHSWGSYLGVLVASRRPDLIHAYVGVGQIAVMGEPIRKVQLEFLKNEAARRNDQEALRHLDEHPGDREPLLFRYGVEIRSMESFYPLFWEGLTAPEYSARDVFRIVKGLNLYSQEFTYNSITGDLQDVVTHLDVPVYFATGRYDYTDPFVLTEEYFRRISAPHKELVWFENSAHFPFYEEPKEFAELIRRVASASN
jgi:pimeloyl-ACP methyl ester carboxylesterase